MPGSFTKTLPAQTGKAESLVPALTVAPHFPHPSTASNISSPGAPHTRVHAPRRGWKESERGHGDTGLEERKSPLLLSPGRESLARSQAASASCLWVCKLQTGLSGLCFVFERTHLLVSGGGRQMCAQARGRFGGAQIAQIPGIFQPTMQLARRPPPPEQGGKPRTLPKLTASTSRGRAGWKSQLFITLSQPGAAVQPSSSSLDHFSAPEQLPLELARTMRKTPHFGIKKKKSTHRCAQNTANRDPQ